MSIFSSIQNYARGSKLRQLGKKEIKDIQIEKWELKLPPATGDMMLYTENPKKFKYNKTERTNEQV